MSTLFFETLVICCLSCSPPLLSSTQAKEPIHLLPNLDLKDQFYNSNTLPLR